MFAIGRLDLETEGLLLITNDGELANRIAHPSHGVDKEYLAEVEGGEVPAGKIRQLREGVELDDGVTAPAKVSQPEPGVLRIVIHEGKNRQVRRMCDAIGHPVQPPRADADRTDERPVAAAGRVARMDQRRTQRHGGGGRHYDRPP